MDDQLGTHRLLMGSGFTDHGLVFWATLALSANVHPRVAQERLGHPTVGITLGVYSHVTEGMQADAAALVTGLMTTDPISDVSNPLATAAGDDHD